MIRKWFQLIFPFTSIALTCSTYTTLAIAYERFPSSLNVLFFASFCVSCSLLLFLPCFIYYICIIYMQGDNSTTNTFWRSFIPRSFFASITEKSRNARGFFWTINMLINNNLFKSGWIVLNFSFFLHNACNMELSEKEKHQTNALQLKRKRKSTKQMLSNVCNLWNQKQGKRKLKSLTDVILQLVDISFCSFQFQRCASLNLLRPLN